MQIRSVVVVVGLVGMCWGGVGAVHAGAAAAKPAGHESPGSLVVYVRDADWHVPIPFVSVLIVDSKRGLLTDSTGIGRFARLPAGVVELRAQYLGYRPVRVAATIRPGVRDTLGIALHSVIPTDHAPTFIVNPTRARELLDSVPRPAPKPKP